MIIPTHEDSLVWEQIAPHLDDAMLQLSEQERWIVVLRFFQNRSFAQVGEELGLSEDAARMRLNRALDKLRSLLLKKGVVCAPMALGMLISERAIQATPAPIVSAILGAVVTVIKPTSAFTFAEMARVLFQRQGFIGKAVLIGVTLLLVFDGAFYLHNHFLATNGIGHKPVALHSGSMPDLIASGNHPALDARNNASQSVFVEGVITVLTGDEVTNVTAQFAPVVNMSVARGRYRLLFSDPAQISSLSSGNLYRVKGMASGIVPNDSPRRWLKVEQLSLIKVYGDNDRRLLTAAAARNIQLMKEAIANGADVDSRSGSFKTPLHNALIFRVAARRAFMPWEPTEEVQLLLENGADINAEDDSGNTPMHFAVYSGFFELVELLLVSGANAAVQDIEGVTPCTLSPTQMHTVMARVRPGEELDYGRHPPPPSIGVIQVQKTNNPSPNVKHEAAVAFFNSPARDTAECRMMLEQLSKHGYGIEYLEPIYLACGDITSRDPEYSRFFTSSSGTLLRRSCHATQDNVRRLEVFIASGKASYMHRFTNYDVVRWIKPSKINNKELLERLLEIRVKVPYSVAINKRQIEKPEQELSDQDVWNYVKSHPVKDPPFKLTSELTSEEVEQAEAQHRIWKVQQEEREKKEIEPQ